MLSSNSDDVTAISTAIEQRESIRVIEGCIAVTSFQRFHDRYTVAQEANSITEALVGEHDDLHINARAFRQCTASSM